MASLVDLNQSTSLCVAFFIVTPKHMYMDIIILTASASGRVGREICVPSRTLMQIANDCSL